ncbi:MAG: hypothetical protein Q8934_16980 [Bacillota bacterium]|nr:hypothetical protein [Bacillota bacterium]
MNDKFSKLILTGILICLIIIAINLNNIQISTPNPNINVSAETGEEIIQLAPNRIAVVDNSTNSGMRGTILVYEYNNNKKTFEFIGNFNYADYFSNPQKYGIPMK